MYCFISFVDVVGLVSAVKDVCSQTRDMRTTVWCAVHLVTCDNIPKLDSALELGADSSSKMNAVEGTGVVS